MKSDMSKQEKNIWEKLENLPREFLYGLLLIAFIVPMINPMGLPLPVTPEVKKWYDTIEALPSGAAIIIDQGYSGGGEPECGPFAVAVYHHIFRKGGLRVIGVATTQEGPLLWDKAMAEVNPEKYGRKYGVDYIMLGYFAGVETAMAALGKDLRALTSTDYKGASLDQYPVMQGIKGATTVNLLICYTTGGDQSEGWVRQWYTPYKTPYLCNVLALMMPTMLPYMKAGQIVSLTSGAQAGQMESLVKVPARGIAGADVMTFTEILVSAFVVVGNIAYFGRRASKKKA